MNSRSKEEIDAKAAALRAAMKFLLREEEPAEDDATARLVESALTTLAFAINLYQQDHK